VSRPAAQDGPRWGNAEVVRGWPTVRAARSHSLWLLVCQVGAVVDTKEIGIPKPKPRMHKRSLTGNYEVRRLGRQLTRTRQSGAQASELTCYHLIISSLLPLIP
jgi:hypothetical protein